MGFRNAFQRAASAKVPCKLPKSAVLLFEASAVHARFEGRRASLTAAPKAASCRAKWPNPGRLGSCPRCLCKTRQKDRGSPRPEVAYGFGKHFPWAQTIPCAWKGTTQPSFCWLSNAKLAASKIPSWLVSSEALYKMETRIPSSSLPWAACLAASGARQYQTQQPQEKVYKRKRTS